MSAVVEPRVELPTQYMAVAVEPGTFDSGRLQVVMEHALKHPYWFPAPSNDFDRAVSASMHLHDPLNRVWEVWRGGEFVGILLLWRISPGVDALCHFVFFDQQLVGKQKLLLAFLDHCYHDLGFRRISLEVPEFVGTLVSFARRKLGFHFEGEGRTTEHPEVQRLAARGQMDRPNLWIAQQGSRREGCHWHRGVWHDVLCLRQTKEEFLAFVGA